MANYDVMRKVLGKYEGGDVTVAEGMAAID